MDVHRCRFVPYQPSAINALAFSHASNPDLPKKGPPNLRLAIGRANGDIEIWNPLRGAWYQETIFRGGKDRSIEGLVWTQEPEDVDKHGSKTAGRLRLFSIGYSTAVTEWDLASGRPARHSSGNYGEIWCMAAQPKAQTPKSQNSDTQESTARTTEAQTQNIAVGCADGAIVLLNTSEGDLRFSRILARPSKKRSRVLSITFQDRYTIIAGHADSTIRIYDVRNNQQMRSMTLGTGPQGGPKETLVWSVTCLADGTIVSGDSNGTISFWNGKNYTLLQRIRGHDADILDLAVSADGQSVFSAGIDRRTTLYRRTGSGRPGERLRWAKNAHQRFHRHDVKAMATFESKKLSVLVSGGFDTAPLIVPIQEFGRENHRTLSNLPQHPILRSAPRRRRIISWWDRELRIWIVIKSHSPTMEAVHEVEGPEGRKLVAKIAIQGEESITSADISSDGDLVAISTMSELKLFRLIHKPSHLKVQKLELPHDMANMGAKAVHVSPDMKWLAIVRADNSVHLHRIIPDEEPDKDLAVSPKVLSLKRLHRDAVKANPQYGSLGEYDRSITCVAFSSDSRILAIADLSGFLDTWVLEGYEDLTQDNGKEIKADPSRTSEDEDSDEDVDEEGHPTVILGQHWIRNPSASLLIKLPASPLILSFRPSATQSRSDLSNGLGVHPTRHTPHPHSHDLPSGEDRLFVLTAENQMYEFNVLSGRISDWSRRNPTSSLPRQFRDLRDRAMGAVWDVHAQKERIWLYGVSWLWMFDLSRDLPTSPGTNSRPPLTNGTNESKQLKRKRKHDSDDDSANDRWRHDTGSGSKVPKSELNLGVSSKVRRINGAVETEGQAINIGRGQNDESEEDDGDDVVLANENDSALVYLRRNAAANNHTEQTDSGEPDGDISDNEATQVTKSDGKQESHWHTFKYRPILGIVPLGSRTDDEAGGKDGQSDEDENEDYSRGLEVALVERPIWDVELPPRYYGNQEWDP